LLLLIKDYEDKHFHIPTPDPIEAIRLKMEERGLKAKDLEPIMGSKGHVSSILSGRRELTLKMAQRLRDFFQLPPDIFIRTSA
jgi:HTH-type transcriptional regulator/antitoxin HigA